MEHLAIAGGEPVRRTPFPRWPVWGQEEIHAVQAVVESGCWGAQQGTEVHRFEAEFAAYQGAAWQGWRAGTLGHAAGFSFQSSKNITAGEGGMILTNDPAIGALARTLSNCGRQPEGLWYAHYVLDGNYRLSELHGALLRVQLRRYPAQLAQRQANTAYLEQAVSEVVGITTLRQDARVTSNAYHVLFLQYHADAFGGASKERFVAALHAEGIDGIHAGYSLPVYRQSVLRAEIFGLATPPLASGV